MWHVGKTPPIEGIVASAALVLALSLAPATAQARVETLRWQHPDPSTVSFFRVYLRDVSGDYGPAIYEGLPIVDGNTYSYSLVVADQESVYVSVTAVGASFLESEPSNEQLRAPDPDSPLPPDSGVGSGIGTGGGGGGAAINVVSPGPGEFLAELSGREKLRIMEIGGERDTLRIALAFGDGRWMALDAEDRIISGTFQPLGDTGRKARLQLDDASLDLMLALIDSWAPQLGAVDYVTQLRRAPKILLKLNRDRTRVKLKGKLKLGESEGEIDLGTYRFVARGPLVEPQERPALR